MSDNYFSLFDMPVQYSIDKMQLTNNYRRLQKSIHPDNYAHASDMDKRLSMQKSTQINDAYQILKNPLKRAIYLLELHDLKIKDNESTTDSEFLMQQMELREQLSKLRHKDDPKEALKQIQQLIDETIKNIDIT